MNKIRRFEEEVTEFYSYLNFIENNLSLSSTEIIKKILKKHNLSRTTLDRKFKKLYTSNKGYPETLSTYIKRRQNKENILKGGRILGLEERYDMRKILDKVKNMNIINNYSFYNIDKYDIDVNNEDTYTNNIYKSNLNIACKEYHYNKAAEDEYIVVIKRLGLCK